MIITITVDTDELGFLVESGDYCEGFFVTNVTIEEIVKYVSEEIVKDDLEEE